jgi:tripartite-type tricarboxylate transporter receptor subunit TctC
MTGEERMETRRRFLQRAAAAAAVPASASAAWALDYPSRPVRFVVSFGPGGPADVFARLVAQKLSDRFGRQFFVENVAGGGGNIGAMQVARAAPDGHAILFTVSAFVSNVAFHGKAPYDPVQDFAPVAMPAASAMVIAVQPSLGVATLDELVALVRANPGRYPFASGGAGAQPHLAFERFRLSLGLDMTHVPFSGAGPEVAALVAGHVAIGMSSLPPCVPHIQEGRLRGLVLTSKMRSPSVPDVPTAVEAGYPILEGDQWIGVLAPAGAPAEIVQLLHSSIADAAALPDVKERLAAVDIYGVEATPEDFGARIRTELETWRRVVRDAHLAPG